MTISKHAVIVCMGMLITAGPDCLAYRRRFSNMERAEPVAEALRRVVPCHDVFIDHAGVYHLMFSGLPISNLSFIPDVLMPLLQSVHDSDEIQVYLYFGGTGIDDISPLEGLPIVGLDIRGTRVNDLTPLRNMPITELNIGSTKVKDLSPIRGLPLQRLVLRGTTISDLTHLAGMPLQYVNFLDTSVKDVSCLNHMTVILEDHGGVAHALPASIDPANHK